VDVSHVLLLLVGMEVSPDFSEVSSNVCLLWMVGYYQIRARIPCFGFGRSVGSLRNLKSAAVLRVI